MVEVVGSLALALLEELLGGLLDVGGAVLHSGVEGLRRAPSSHRTLQVLRQGLIRIDETRSRSRTRRLKEKNYHEGGSSKYQQHTHSTAQLRERERERERKKEKEREREGERVSVPWHFAGGGSIA